MVESDVLCASIEIPFPDRQAVGMLMVDQLEKYYRAVQDPEGAARRHLVLHYNHWRHGRAVVAEAPENG